MTEFFHNRFGKEDVEAFSDQKEYNQKYVDQAIAANFDATTYTPNPTACAVPTSNFVTTTCVKEYAYNANKYDKLTVKNNTLNGTFGDGKEKNSEIIISNINLGIGIAIMLSYIYSMA